MKKFAACLLALMLMLPVYALGEGPVLLMEMPDSVQMIENVEFDDGDFIQTYQLAGGAMVHLLRYADFGMTVDDLIASEWPDTEDVAVLAMDHVGGYPAQGVSFQYSQDGSAVSVTMVLVNCGAGTLVFEAIVPKSDAQGAAAVQTMLDTMDVLMGGAGEAKGMEAEVG